MRAGLLAAALCAAVIGCGGDPAGPTAATSLEWVKPPTIVAATTAEPARILQGEFRNASGRELRIAADEVILRDAGGATMPGDAIFVGGYVRPGEPQNRGGAPFADSEAERIGRLAVLAPGETTPLVVSWRVGDGRPAEIGLGSGTLAVAGKP